MAQCRDGLLEDLLTGNLQEIYNSALALGGEARFNGFLFKIDGNLVLSATCRQTAPDKPPAAADSDLN